MKPRYRKVSVRVWSDAGFRGLSDDAKLLWFLVLTHPHTAGLGALRANAITLGLELGWPGDRAEAALSAIEGAGFIERDEAAGLVVIKHYFRHNGPESPNVVKSWAKALDGLPECPLLYEQLGRAEAFVCDQGEAFAEAFREAFPEGWRHPSLNHRTQNTEHKERECVNSLREHDAPALEDEPSPEAPASGDADPLDGFPRLSKAWPRILEALAAAHSKARLPKPGGKVEREWRHTLAALVRLDGYEEADVVGVLKWALISDDADAQFWRRQVAAIPPLRKRKDGLTKFDRISEAFQNARGGAPAHGAARDALRTAIVAHAGAGGAE